MIVHVNTCGGNSHGISRESPVRPPSSQRPAVPGLAPRSVRLKDLYFRTDRVLRTSAGARPGTVGTAVSDGQCDRPGQDLGEQSGQNGPPVGEGRPVLTLGFNLNSDS